MGSLKMASVSHKQIASLRHPVTPVVLRDKIKGTFDRRTCIDRRSNSFPALLSVKI
jgi:hypothetical protein